MLVLIFLVMVIVGFILTSTDDCFDSLVLYLFSIIFKAVGMVGLAITMGYYLANLLF